MLKSFVTNATLSLAGIALVILFAVSSWKAFAGKSNRLHWCVSAGLFYVAALCFVFKAFTKDFVDANNVLREPFFFLIPVGFLFLALGGASATVRLALDSFKARRREKGAQTQ